MRFSRVLVFFCAFLLFFILMGCGQPLAAIEEEIASGHAEQLRLDDADVSTILALKNIEPLVLDLAWERAFPQFFTASVSPGGDLVTVFSTFSEGRRKWMGLKVFDTRGDLVWEHLFKDGEYRSGWGRVLSPSNHIGAAAFHYNGMGNFYLFDSLGRLLWTRPVWGNVSAVMSVEAERLALIDHARGMLYLLDLSGQELRSYPVTTGATAQFMHGGDYLLVQDGKQVFIVTARGRQVFKSTVDPETQRHATFSHGGKYIAVSTGDGDSSVYLFDFAGQQLWSYLLYFGGTNQLAFSPDDSYLAVYDVGRRAGLYLFDVETGELAWRYFFEVPAEHKVSLRHLAFTPDSSLVVAHVVEGYQDQTIGFTEKHALVVFTIDGKVKWKADLGKNIEYHLSANGKALVIGSNSIAGNGDFPSNTLAYYNLDPLLTPFEGKEEDHEAGGSGTTKGD